MAAAPPGGGRSFKESRMPRRRSPDLSLAATVLALSIGAGLAVGKAMKTVPRRPPDSAPGRTARCVHPHNVETSVAA